MFRRAQRTRVCFLVKTVAWYDYVGMDEPYRAHRWCAQGRRRSVRGRFQYGPGPAVIAFGAPERFATCLRLEEIYWTILERIAEANQCTVNAVLSYVDREVHLRHGGVKNFSGLIRVVCVVYLLGAKVTR